MQAINFNFRADTPAEAQQAALQEIRNWPEVHDAQHLKPDARNPVVQRMAFAYVADGEQAAELMKKLERVPVVETASVPAARRLAGGQVA